MAEDAIVAELERALSAPDDRIAPAALAVARLEYPDLDPQRYVAELDEFGREAARRLEGVDAPHERLIALNRYVFGALGFSGNRDLYIDPRNSFLNDVLERRIGIPITLALVYIEIGRRAGLPLQGVGFPGHFLARWKGTPDLAEPLVVDAFDNGKLLSQTECVALLREHGGETAEWRPQLLEPANRREIVIRILSNLKHAYVAMRSFPHARRVSDLLVALNPSAITELRDRGLLAYHLQDFAAALRDLEAYLQLMVRAEQPPAEGGPHEPSEEAREAFQGIWEHVKNLRRRVASFN